MTPPKAARDDGPSADEAARIGTIYGRYARSRRRRRAWSAGNRGNVAIRTDLFAAATARLAPAIEGPGTILDVGCGSGRWLDELQRAGVVPARLAGVDIQESRLELVRQRFPLSDIRIADARSLPFGSQSCAAVTLFVVVSSFGDDEAAVDALREARRVLHPNGLLLVYEPRLPNPLNRNVRLVRNRALVRAGLRQVERIPLTLFPPLARRLGPMTPHLYHRLARLTPLNTHRLYVCRRD